MQAILALEDGTLFHGRAFGAAGERTGEVVFNTGMTGYQEVLTDASYKGQMVCMTYPHIGNYGVNSLDLESCAPQAEAMLVRDVTEEPSNWLSEGSLPDLLARHNVMGITDIDTRALTKHIRLHGVMRAVLSTVDADTTSLVRKAAESPDISALHLVAQVSTKEAYHWTEGTPEEWSAARYGYREPALPHPVRPYRVVVLDTGVKYNILRRLVDSGCDVWVVPHDTPVSEVLRHEPEGIVFPNGPGDPEAAVETLEAARSLMGVKPIFGICLGHQILGLAAGGRRFKLKFGHHGFNHPARLLRTGAVEITSQNHNYAIDIASLNTDEIEVTHINLNDGTLEGTRHRNVPIYSVQFHPEASPGPHDSSMTFQPFVGMMEEARR